MGTIANLHDRIAKAFALPAPDRREELSPEILLSPTGPIDPLHGGAGHATALQRLGMHLRRVYGIRRPHLERAPGAPSETSSAARSRQIAAVVHEIRTPLNGILGMTHLLGQTGLTAEQQNYLSSIRQSGHMLAQLVDDMLDLSTIEAGRFRLNNRAANLRQLIESVIEMLAPRAHEKRIEVAATFSAHVPELLDFDPARLRQVLFNVIGNAVKFTQEGGVLVRVGVIDDVVEIAVADTGPGMTAPEMTRIVGEFEQAGSAEARSGGTGLGLGITSRILQEFSGSLSARSLPGVGSTFIIRFPMRLAEDAAAGDVDRSRMLSSSHVLLLAPHGPSAEATISTITALGGKCRHLSCSREAQALLDQASAAGEPFTDLIVDHRLASDHGIGVDSAPLHRILLVNPEERASQPQELFDAWLIRPLREKSLIDVLSGRLRGLGYRPAARAAAIVDPVPVKEGRSLDVLLAEDDPVSATIVRSILQKAGHRVRWVADVPDMSEALSAHNNRLDLVISDMNMPGGQPLDVIGRLVLDQDRHLAVIVLTGQSGDMAHRDARDAGADKVLTKPVDPAILLEEIRVLMAKKQQMHQLR
jgi:signal transduction histidine kinase/CheY-like chemotaxis protein